MTRSEAAGACRRIGMITIGQAPRTDVVPDMAALLGPGVEIVERGALDGLDARAIAGLAPTGADEILVTRLADGRSVFVGKRHVIPRLEAGIAELEAGGVELTVVLCTGAFPRLAARRPSSSPSRCCSACCAGWCSRGGSGC